MKNITKSQIPSHSLECPVKIALSILLSDIKIKDEISSQKLTPCKIKGKSCLIEIIQILISTNSVSKSDLDNLCTFLSNEASKETSLSSVKPIDILFKILTRFHYHSLGQSCEKPSQHKKKCQVPCIYHSFFNWSMTCQVLCGCGLRRIDYSDAMTYNINSNIYQVLNNLSQDLALHPSFKINNTLETNTKYYKNCLKNHLMKSEEFRFICPNQVCRPENCKKEASEVKPSVFLTINFNWDKKPDYLENLLSFISVNLSFSLSEICADFGKLKYKLYGIILGNQGTFELLLMSSLDKSNYQWPELIKSFILKKYYPVSLIYRQYDTEDQFNFDDVYLNKLEALAYRLDWCQVFGESESLQLNIKDIEILERLLIKENKEQVSQASKKNIVNMPSEKTIKKVEEKQHSPKGGIASEKWTCSCKKQHLSNSEFCSSCLCIKEGISGWVCLICKVLIPENQPICKGCLCVNLMLKKAWICMNCKSDNIKDRMQCRNCSAINPKYHDILKVCSECGRTHRVSITCPYCKKSPMVYKKCKTCKSNFSKLFEKCPKCSENEIINEYNNNGKNCLKCNEMIPKIFKMCLRCKSVCKINIKFENTMLKDMSTKEEYIMKNDLVILCSVCNSKGLKDTGYHLGCYNSSTKSSKFCGKCNKPMPAHLGYCSSCNTRPKNLRIKDCRENEIKPKNFNSGKCNCGKVKENKNSELCNACIKPKEITKKKNSKCAKCNKQLMTNCCGNCGEVVKDNETACKSCKYEVLNNLICKDCMKKALANKKKS